MSDPVQPHRRQPIRLPHPWDSPGKNTGVGMTNLDSILKSTEDRISELEDRMVEINQSERKKEKQIKRNEDNLRDLQDNIKRYNIRIIGVPEEEDKKKDHEKILEEIIVENFPKMGKEIITQVQETQRVPPSWEMQEQHCLITPMTTGAKICSPNTRKQKN